MNAEDTGWVRVAARYPKYQRRWGKIDAMVWLDKELWRNSVAYEGATIDMGEWDCREQAFRNARGAMVRAIKFRSLSRYAKDFDKEDDDE